MRFEARSFRFPSQISPTTRRKRTRRRARARPRATNWHPPGGATYRTYRTRIATYVSETPSRGRIFSSRALSNEKISLLGARRSRRCRDSSLTCFLSDLGEVSARCGTEFLRQKQHGMKTPVQVGIIKKKRVPNKCSAQQSI